MISNYSIQRKYHTGVGALSRLRDHKSSQMNNSTNQDVVPYSGKLANIKADGNGKAGVDLEL